MEAETKVLLARIERAEAALRDALSSFLLTQGGVTYPEWHWSVCARALLAELNPEEAKP